MLLSAEIRMSLFSFLLQYLLLVFILLQSEHLSLKSKHDNAGFRSEVRNFIQPKLPTAKHILSQDRPGTRAFIYLFIDCMTEYSKHLF